MDRLVNWFVSMKNRANLLIIGQGEKHDELVDHIENFGLTGYVKIMSFQNNPFPHGKG